MNLETPKKLRILILELDCYHRLPSEVSTLIATYSSELIRTKNTEEAKLEVGKKDPFDVFIANGPSYEIFKLVHTKYPDCVNILATDLTMDDYSTQMNNVENIILSHTIANIEPYEITSHELITCLQKIIRNDIFGIDKYLRKEYIFEQHTITSSHQRQSLNKLVTEFTEKYKFGKSITRAAFGISEEFLMNAVYDAPVAGNPDKYKATPRTQEVNLSNEEAAQLTYGFDQDTFAISIADPFGAMQQNIFNNYLKKIIFRAESSTIIDDKIGGAGLGLMKILHGCHSLICNVEQNKKTEFIAIFYLDRQIKDFSRMTRSCSFFQKR